MQEEFIPRWFRWHFLGTTKDFVEFSLIYKMSDEQMIKTAKTGAAVIISAIL